LLLTRAAATLNITPKELEKREVQDRVQQVTEADVQSFVEKNKARFGKARVPDRDLLKSIGEGLQAQRLEDRRQDYYRDLRSKAGIQIHLEPPRVPVGVDGGAVKGPATAPVTIVEFSDFQCPFCSRAAQVLKQIEERYKGQVRVVFRDFPLPKHEQAAKAAEAASCANEQGHFWPMHDRIFENQANLQTGDLKRLASEIGLNREAFDRCLDTGKYANRLRRDVEEGESYGVRGTPTLFINGRLITKPLTYGYVVSVIEEELAAMRQQASRHTRQDTPFQNPDHGS
jgi:protein-disulfide isomerase